MLAKPTRRLSENSSAHLCITSRFAQLMYHLSERINEEK